jgi:ketosteroid isomerase-like protein
MSTTTTPTQPLVETVQSLYAAFGRGDVGTIVAAMHPNVDWHVNVDPKAPGVASVPSLAPRRGPQGVAEFFQALASSLDFHSFQPVAFLAGSREVAVRVLIDTTVRSTGRRMQMEAIHHYTFDAAGKVTRFVDFADTLAEAAAWDVVRAVK